jgi:hypothetical protein
MILADETERITAGDIEYIITGDTQRITASVPPIVPGLRRRPGERRSSLPCVRWPACCASTTPGGMAAASARRQGPTPSARTSWSNTGPSELNRSPRRARMSSWGPDACEPQGHLSSPTSRTPPRSPWLQEAGSVASMQCNNWSGQNTNIANLVVTTHAPLHNLAAVRYKYISGYPLHE